MLRSGVAVLHFGFKDGVVVNNACVDRQQHRGTVGFDSGANKLRRLPIGRQALRTAHIFRDADLIASVDGGARTAEKDERAARVRAVFQLRSELFDCQAGERDKEWK